MKAETHVAPATVPRALAQFFIRVTASLQERRPRTMKHADTFAVFDHNGDALAGPGSPEGIYHRDTRYLSHLYMTVDGHRPLLLSSTIRDDNAVLICDLTNPEIAGPEGERLIAQDLVHIHRSRLFRTPAPSSGWRSATTTRKPATLASPSRSPPTSPTSSKSAAPSAPAAACCTRRRSRPTPSPWPTPGSMACAARRGCSSSPRRPASAPARSLSRSTSPRGRRNPHPVIPHGGYDHVFKVKPAHQELPACPASWMIVRRRRTTMPPKDAKTDARGRGASKVAEISEGWMEGHPVADLQ